MERVQYDKHPGIKASPQNVPSHLAIIMDGNGRWAARQGLSRTAGHRRGVIVASDMITLCQQKGIKVLTLFAFGRENWKRPSKEVRNVFRLFLLALRKETSRLMANNIRLRVIGDRSIFTGGLLSAIQETEQLTRHNDGLTLNMAVNYSGRWDLLNAIQKMIDKAHNNDLPSQAISEELISGELALAGLPEPDLFIRTGGVQRISNFILWELAYTELFFTKTLWPDFTPQEFEKALSDFAMRERRFGLTGEQL